jgi:chromosome partitioning protein
MAKIISFTNQKGGVGKTTTCVNLSAYLAVLGQRVLMIDLDPQGNATSGVGVEKHKGLRTINELISGENTFNECVIETQIVGLDVIPSTVDLATAEVSLVSMPQREKVLKKILDEVANDYDFIMIDCSPSLGLLTINALTASNSVIIPMQCEFYALDGLTQLMNTIRLVKYHLNPDLDVEGVVRTMKDNRSNLINQVSQEIIRFFKNKVFDTYIPRNIRLAEAPSHGLPIVLYDPGSKGAEAYLSLAEEFLNRNKIKYPVYSKNTKLKLRKGGSKV